MYEAVKVRLDPTPRQERLLRSHAGGARFAYNLMLTHVKRQLSLGESPDWTMYSMRRWWNEWKREIAPWWAENSKEAYNSGFEWLADGLRNFSDSRKGKRAGKRVGFPKYKSKRSSMPRFTYTTGAFGLVENDSKALKLPRIGRVHCMENAAKLVAGDRVVRMTVSEKAGRWYAALTVERPAFSPVRKHKRHKSVGVDLGIKTLATLSDGTVVENPRRYVKMQRKLKRAQQTLSRRDKDANRGRGAKRWQKAKHRVQKISARIANQRQDGLNKLTTWLADNYTDIHIEDLNVQGMGRNHGLAKHVYDAGFAEFRRQLAYKTARTGATLHVVDRWYPSSKTCSRCGTVKTKLSLNERTYSCEACGLIIDRDLNAAINLEHYSVAPSAEETVNARGEDTRRNGPDRATRTSKKREPSNPIRV